MKPTQRTGSTSSRQAHDVARSSSRLRKCLQILQRLNDEIASSSSQLHGVNEIIRHINSVDATDRYDLSEP